MNRKKLRPKAYHFTLHDTSGYMKVTCHSSVRPHLPPNSPAHHGFHPPMEGILLQLQRTHFSTFGGLLWTDFSTSGGHTYPHVSTSGGHTFPLNTMNRKKRMVSDASLLIVDQGQTNE
ncbi:hypothetical protein BgiMline_011006 [Biomphalaria glabrata]|nr:hypothetical protein BgiMline_026979 [Biomphalaria glabrata]